MEMFCGLEMKAGRRARNSGKNSQPTKIPFLPLLEILAENPVL
jgi:hypothetical protein